MSLLVACGKADISAYSSEPILVTGLGEDFYVTASELAELECVSDTAVGETEKAGTVKAYGPMLETFLEAHGYKLSDIHSLRTLAKDDYVVTLGRATWDTCPVILSIANGSDPLFDKQQPLRLVIPGGKSGNWTYAVIEMHFTLETE